MRAIVLAVVLAAAPAHAQPSPTPPISEPDAYVAGGAEVGGSDAAGAAFAAATLQVGYRFHGRWWAHGMLLGGPSQSGGWFATPQDGRVGQLRGGIEWKSGAVVLGVDLAFVRETMTGSPTFAYDGAAGAFHAGLDLGGEHLRVRPALDLLAGGKLPGEPAIGGKDYTSFGLGAAVAYTW